MNKKLIALAVAGACTAPAAWAQTANPVTLYGQLRMDLEHVKAEGSSVAANNASARTRLIDHPSLFGIRGTEDLGGGLTAWFQLETAFETDDAGATHTTAGANSSGVFNRNSAVGLRGKWGDLSIGRWDTPMKMAIGATDLWGDVNRADYTAGTMDQGNFSRRDANIVQYWSPMMGGFQVRLMYQVDEQKGATNPQDQGISLTWTRGGLYLAAAYEEHKDQAGSTATSGVDEKGTAIGAKWTAGNFTLSGHYGEYKKVGGAKDKSYYVGGQYNMGKNEFILTWQTMEQGAAECDVLGVGWRYRFSRRTHIQFTYGEIDNNATGNCNFGAGGSLGGTGSDPQGFGLGVFHVF